MLCGIFNPITLGASFYFVTGQATLGCFLPTILPNDMSATIGNPPAALYRTSIYLGCDCCSRVQHYHLELYRRNVLMMAGYAMLSRSTDPEGSASVISDTARSGAMGINGNVWQCRRLDLDADVFFHHAGPTSLLEMARISTLSHSCWSSHFSWSSRCILAIGVAKIKTSRANSRTSATNRCSDLDWRHSGFRPKP